MCSLIKVINDSFSALISQSTTYFSNLQLSARPQEAEGLEVWVGSLFSEDLQPKHFGRILF